MVVQAGLGIKTSKITKAKRARSISQMVECLSMRYRVQIPVSFKKIIEIL
jgi:hypothetical protein